MFCTLLLLGVFLSIKAQTHIPLEEYFRSLRTVKVDINGKTYDFLFDSGAGMTMISPEIAHRLGKKVYGSSVGFRMNGEKVATGICDSLELRIGGVKLMHTSVGVFDIMTLLPPEFKRLDGVISLQSFRDCRITLNLRKQELILETERSFLKQVGDRVPVPSRFANGTNGTDLTLLLGVRTDSGLWWFLADTGNIASVKLSQHIPGAWALQGRRDENGSLQTGVLELGGTSYEVPVSVEDLIYDGVLNYDLIEKLEVSISFKDQKAWIKSSNRKR